MKSTEFAYWLQGYFEIAGTTDLTKKQCGIISARLENVTMDVGASADSINRFVAITKQDIKRLGQTLGIFGDDPETCKQFGESLSTRLNALFQHDIDPNYNGDQTHFNNIHKFGGPEPGARC